MRTLPPNQKTIEATHYSGDGMARERIRIAGTEGLLLELSPKGKRTWYVYATQGKGAGAKKVWRKIGSASAISVKRAIELANQQVEDITTGTAEPEPSETFDALFRDHLEQHRKKERRSWQEDEAFYNRRIAGAIGSTPVNQLDRRAIVAALNQIESESTRSQARNAHYLISATFKWGIGNARCFDNPAAGIPSRKPLEFRERKLTEAELRTIWRESARLGRTQQIIVQLLLMLGGRRQEVTAMQRAELAKPGFFALSAQRRKKWRIGKKPTPHVLPLLPLAQSLIDEALSLARESKFVFPNRTVANDGPMSADSISSAFARLMTALKIEGAQLRDLRSAAKTIMVDAGVPREYADAVQDHSGLGNAGDIYDRSEYLMHKKAALEVLEREVLRIVSCR
jgi:integrase